MEDKIEIFKSNLIQDKDIISDLKSRNRSYDQMTIKNQLLTEYENKGWTKVKENKETVVIRKPKSHDKAFEDRVWSSMAKMGFEQMNGSTNLKLIYSNQTNIPGRQIDVFACDKETILIIECKSSEELKKKSMQTIINDFITVKNGSSIFLQKLFYREKRKVKFILATNNLILSDIDKERLKAEHIEHFNQDDIEYYDQLNDRLGQASKYQLLGRLFKNQEIPQLENKVPAIQGKMGGYTYYSFSLEPEKLLKIGYILHRTEINTEDDGYQRMVSKSRLKEIESFLDNEDEENQGFFPNSIIINISTNKEEPLNFDRLSATHDSKIAEPVILHLPKRFHSAFIIDGQHRLYGYANSKWKYKNSIPVVAFENLPPEKQVELFVQINSKQKPVSKTVLIPIAADLMWNSDKPKDAITSLKAKLIQRLGEKDNSPLYKRIQLTENPRTEITCITQEYIIANALNKSNYFSKFQKSNLIALGHLYVDPKNEGYSKMLDKCYTFFKSIFDYVETNLNLQWRIGNGEGGFISTNIGVLIIIRIVDNIIDHLIEKENFNPINSSAETIASQTYKYLDIIIKYISTLDHQKIKQIRSMSASAQGIENLVREFQKRINESKKEFNPKGLDQWIKDNSGEFNETSKEITERLEFAIRENIFMTLKMNFNERWWLDGVSKEIQKKAAVTAIEKGNEEPHENFLFLLDYKTIIEKNWTFFKDLYADPQFKTGKENQLKWFDRLNEIRNKVSHPGRAKVSEAEATFLKELDGWLYEQIENED
jgi:DNA sulfur modification protein DndB